MCQFTVVPHQRAKSVAIQYTLPQLICMLECDNTSTPKIKYTLHYEDGTDGRNMHTDSNAYFGCNCVATKLASGSPRFAHNMDSSCLSSGTAKIKVKYATQLHLFRSNYVIP
jgi:hypothetical protein